MSLQTFHRLPPVRSRPYLNLPFLLRSRHWLPSTRCHRPTVRPPVAISHRHQVSLSALECQPSLSPIPPAISLWLVLSTFRTLRGRGSGRCRPRRRCLVVLNGKNTHHSPPSTNPVPSSHVYRHRLFLHTSPPVFAVAVAVAIYPQIQLSLPSTSWPPASRHRQSSTAVFAISHQVWLVLTVRTLLRGGHRHHPCCLCLAVLDGKQIHPLPPSIVSTSLPTRYRLQHLNRLSLAQPVATQTLHSLPSIVLMSLPTLYRLQHLLLAHPVNTRTLHSPSIVLMSLPTLYRPRHLSPAHPVNTQTLHSS